MSVHAEAGFDAWLFLLDSLPGRLRLDPGS